MTRTGSYLALISTAILGVGTVRIPSADASEAARTGEIRFTVRAGSESGKVICALFDRAGWLKKPLATTSSSITKRSAECVFSRVAQGTLGVSAFEDRNDNGDLDTNWLGIPKEPWCASRNARGSFGPPSFDDAKFELTGGVLRIGCRAR